MNEYAIEKRAIPVWLELALLFGLPLAVLFASLFVGRYAISGSDIISVIIGNWDNDSKAALANATIVLNIRLPRIILGALVGAALAVSGAAYQSLFRNPLVSPGILGVSSGAGFGAALAILLFGNGVFVYILAFAFGALAVVISVAIGRVYNTTPAIMLVLGGVIVSSVFGALISFTKYIADPYNELPAIVFWMMGSLASAEFERLIPASIPIIIGITGLFLFRWRINVFSMGDKEARALGVDTRIGKALIISFATLATAGAVCVSGIIGWVGLVIPHIGRMIVGNDNRKLIPACMSLGACFLVLVDDLGRVLTGAELPLGILTAIIGGPFFVYLLKRTKGGGW